MLSIPTRIARTLERTYACTLTRTHSRVRTYARTHAPPTDAGLWLSEGTTDVYYATNSSVPQRFVTFMHGAGGGLIIDPFVYHSILNTLASWGFVVASPRVCMDGDCLDKVCRPRCSREC